MNEIEYFKPFLDMILRVDTDRHHIPIYGRLIDISDQFLKLERRDGRITLIKLKTVLAVEPVSNQKGVV
jgi:hypothetical protein